MCESDVYSYVGFGSTFPKGGLAKFHNDLDRFLLDALTS
jgi:hypothetical protein